MTLPQLIGRITGRHKPSSWGAAMAILRMSDGPAQSASGPDARPVARPYASPGRFSETRPGTGSAAFRTAEASRLATPLSEHNGTAGLGQPVLAQPTRTDPHGGICHSTVEAAVPGPAAAGDTLRWCYLCCRCC